MINKTYEVRVDEEFEDDSNYDKSVKEKNQKVLIEFKNLKNFFFKSITCEKKILIV